MAAVFFRKQRSSRKGKTEFTRSFLSVKNCFLAAREYIGHIVFSSILTIKKMMIPPMGCMTGAGMEQ